MKLDIRAENLAFVPYKKDKCKVLIIQNGKEFIKNIVIRIELYEFKENKVRPFKIWYKNKGRQEFIGYKEFIKFLRSVKRIIIPRIYETNLKGITGMLNDYQIKYEIAEICRFCINNDKLTRIDIHNSYLFYNELICRECALKEVDNELKFMNFTPTDQFLSNIKKLLNKFRDVGKILNIIRPGFIAAKSEDFTLYDTLGPKTKSKKISKEVPNYKVADLQIPPEFKEILTNLNIELLPVQNLAISEGLLNNENLLIVAPTSTGKTLCGELAGIPKALNNQVMIYLSPLVSLTNTKFEEFKNKYGNILKVAIRVGMSRINVKGEDLVITDSEIDDADIICASYEAFDYIIRNGEYKNIKSVGTIIIDEIQTLGDQERGVELDGLIARLKVIYPEAQIIALSATIANANEIGDRLGFKTVIYDSRPVPIERHLVLCKSELEKNLNLSVLVKQESKIGATIIFTNSRYGTYRISKYLRRHRLEVPAYHSGLSYYEKKRIEAKLEKNEIPGVVATYALGAGVDLPVSQVVFYSMKMGKDYLGNNMFLQMAGRAGRYKRHERGKVVLLAEVGSTSFSGEKSEDQIALSLLEGHEDAIVLDADPEEIEAQLLAAITAGLDSTNLENFYNYILSAEEEFHYLLKELYKKKMLDKVNEEYKISKLGKATALSFFLPWQTLEIINKMNKKISILQIAVEMEYFNNIYIDDKLKDEISRFLKINLPSMFFSDLIFNLFMHIDKISGKIPEKIIKIMKKWQEVFSCEHDDKPYCDCGLLKINLDILNLRIHGFTPREISQYFRLEYNLRIYPGDIFKMLDDIIHRLKGIRRISKALNLQNYADEALNYIRKLENPYEFKTI